jgi:D-threo-aldose 1-dehydrogenase
MGYDPTERVALGKSGLPVTRLGLGTAPLGGLYRALGDDEAVGTVARALELGLRFFDTAPRYGHAGQVASDARRR